MLKKTIKYTDFNGEEVEEDFYFHLSKAELVELEMSHHDGMLETIKRIIAAEDRAALIKEFKNIVLLSYGVRSSDGRRFTKNQTLREEFESTEAYSTLFMELVTDTDAAIAFFNGIVPEGMTLDEAALAEIDPERTPLIVVESDKPEPRIVTNAEIEEMPLHELDKLREELKSGSAKIAE